jgi:hypothetical protein
MINIFRQINQILGEKVVMDIDEELDYSGTALIDH